MPNGCPSPRLSIIAGRSAEYFDSSDKLVTTLSVATKGSMAEPDRVASGRDLRRKLAEYVRTLGKGSHAIVQGAVRTREYDRDGMKQRVFELRADTMANSIVPRDPGKRN